ncbi:S1C family serine protease [Stieleria varia]|uniref:Putative periplasmic serine endoprotease DegP-like n=1 Tax=Stieleria varia TaxID=2528005 RepID=A0A5C6ADW5_9BACT|nr:trypsin-like peptidase domain-containing protein [Stieleria varia]TWT98242.1 putative periplasmic serine endoprotease DegP-like precursor [Stieleria varia]
MALLQTSIPRWAQRLVCSLTLTAITTGVGSSLVHAQDADAFRSRYPMPHGSADLDETGANSDGRSVSVRRPPVTISPRNATEALVDQNREQLFNELAEEFNAFDRLGNLVRRVSQLVKPSVIHIEAHKTQRHESYDEAGSGVLVRLGGGDWVLTNRHVILGSKPNEILLRTADGREFHPTRIEADPSTDVAVMQVVGLHVPAARVGDSRTVEIGDFLIAIGSPFGLSHSVTFGILSAKGRRDLSLGEQKIDLQDFFQTDAAINPGNSGGPLLNLRGEVIGLNTAIASSSGGSEGIGFAIPINMAIKVADELIEHGELRRGYLGVTLDPDYRPGSGTSLPGGALVKDVRRGSPAERANLQRGDVIIQFNDTLVDNDDHLVAQVGMTEIGSQVQMIIYRDGKRYRTDVTLTDVN